MAGRDGKGGRAGNAPAHTALTQRDSPGLFFWVAFWAGQAACSSVSPCLNSLQAVSGSKQI